MSKLGRVVRGVGVVGALALAGQMLVGCGPGRGAGELLDEALAASARDASAASVAQADDDARAGVMVAYTAARQAEGKTDARYHLTRDGRALRGHNFAQGFSASTDERGFEVKHQQDGWRARFETVAIRCGDRRIEVGAGELRAVVGEPHRASIARLAGKTPFEEWTVNGPLGVEQGFTFPTDPCGGSADEMVIEVGVEGLVPHAAADAIVLRNSADNAVARYDELQARDADGHELAAGLAVVDGRIAVRLATAGRSWPILVDPVVATLVASLLRVAAST